MPIYEYVCQSCGKTFERWSRKVRDSDWKELCPHDGGTGDRVMSITHFKLKGGGWADDGYSDPQNKTNSSTASGDS